MGPTASVLIDRQPTDADRLITTELMKSVGEPGPGGDNGPDVLVSTTESIDGTYLGEGRPFWFEWQGSGYDNLPLARAKIEERLELTPRTALLVSAGINRAVDHRILGELVLRLARALEGVVDFDGALLPRSSPARVERLNWAEVAGMAREFLAPLPGRVVTIEYEVNDSRVWAYHVGDCQFMQGWLQHPDFYMIK